MKAGVHIVDLPMKVAVEDVKKEDEFSDSSQASLKSNLDCRSHNYAFLQIQKFENAIFSKEFCECSYFQMCTPGYELERLKHPNSG